MSCCNLLGILLSIFAVVSCKESSYRRFLDSYSTEDFTQYNNKGFVIRGQDNNDHSMLLFVDNDMSGSKNDGPYIIKVDGKTGGITGISTHLMEDTINLNKVLLQKLALRFLSYNIRSLKVDKEGNVFVGINSERPDLIKFSTEKNMDKYDRNEWMLLKDSWYMRR